MNGNSVPSSGTMSSQVQPVLRGPGGPSPRASLRGNRVGCDATAVSSLDAGWLALNCPRGARFTRVWSDPRRRGPPQRASRRVSSATGGGSPHDEETAGLGRPKAADHQASVGVVLLRDRRGREPHLIVRELHRAMDLPGAEERARRRVEAEENHARGELTWAGPDPGSVSGPAKRGSGVARLEHAAVAGERHQRLEGRFDAGRRVVGRDGHDPCPGQPPGRREGLARGRGRAPEADRDAVRERPAEADERHGGAACTPYGPRDRPARARGRWVSTIAPATATNIRPRLPPAPMPAEPQSKPPGAESTIVDGVAPASAASGERRSCAPPDSIRAGAAASRASGDR